MKEKFLILQVAIETTYVVIQTVLYGVLLYVMIGFEWDAGKFFWFIYYMLMSFIYFTLYGMMVVALTPGHQLAAIAMAFFLSFWNLFSGFLIPRQVSYLKLDHLFYSDFKTKFHPVTIFSKIKRKDSLIIIKPSPP